MSVIGNTKAAISRVDRTGWRVEHYGVLISGLMIAAGAVLLFIAGAINQASKAVADMAKSSHESSMKETVSSRIQTLTNPQIDALIKQALADDERGSHGGGGTEHSYTTKDDSEGFSYRVEFTTPRDTVFRTGNISYLPQLCGRPKSYEITLIHSDDEYGYTFSDPLKKDNFTLNCPVVATAEEQRQADPASMENRQKIAAAYAGTWSIAIACNGQSYNVSLNLPSESLNSHILRGDIDYLGNFDDNANRQASLYVEGDSVKITGISHLQDQTYLDLTMTAPRQDADTSKIEGGKAFWAGRECGTWRAQKAQ